MVSCTPVGIAMNLLNNASMIALLTRTEPTKRNCQLYMDLSVDRNTATESQTLQYAQWVGCKAGKLGVCALSAIASEDKARPCDESCTVSPAGENSSIPVMP